MQWRANFGHRRANGIWRHYTPAAAGTSTNYSIFNRESGRVIRWAALHFLLLNYLPDKSGGCRLHAAGRHFNSTTRAAAAVWIFILFLQPPDYTAI